MIEMALALVLALTLLGTVLATIWLSGRFWHSEIRRQAEEFKRREMQREQYISELHNRLAAGSWQEFTALQQSAPTSVDKTIGALQHDLSPPPDNGQSDFDPEWADPTVNPAWGKSIEDQLEAEMQRRGVDMEGPTIGGG